MANTANQLSTLNFEDNIVLNALNMPDKSKAIWDWSGGYNLIDYLSTRNAPSSRTTGKDGQFEKAIMGSNEVVAQTSANSTLVGTNLKLTFTNPNFENMRVQDVIGDCSASNIKGCVIAKGAGYVVIEPMAGTTWDTSKHFTSGTYATVLFSSAANRGSSTMQSLYTYPDYVKNQTAILHDSLTLYRRDFSDTWMKDYGDGIWGLSQEKYFLQNISYKMEMRGLFDDYGTINSANGGATNYCMGLKASIKDPKRGGIYQALPNVPSQGQFETFIGLIADRQATQKTTIHMSMGRGLLRAVQSYTSDFVKFSGVNNTFGGHSVMGIDVYSYDVMGIHCEFAIAPFLNDKDRFPTLSTIANTAPFTRMQYTGIVLDLNDYTAIDGTVLPAIEKKYFGDEEVIYGYVPGLIGNAASGKPSVFTSGKVFGANSKDAVSLEYYTDCCYDFMSRRMGWLELAF